MLCAWHKWHTASYLTPGVNEANAKQPTDRMVMSAHSLPSMRPTRPYAVHDAVKGTITRPMHPPLYCCLYLTHRRHRFRVIHQRLLNERTRYIVLVHNIVCGLTYGYWRVIPMSKHRGCNLD